MSNRKIYIGETYLTKMGTEFTVDRVVKGNSNNSNSDRRANQTRRAIDSDGNRIKISNLLTIKL